MNLETIVLFVVVILFLSIMILEAILRLKNRRSLSTITLALLVIGVIFTIFVISRRNELETKDWATMIPTIGLVLITSVYAWSTERMAKANEKMVHEMSAQAEETKEMAKATVTLTEEARKQRINDSRPLIIQKVVYEKDILGANINEYYSHFEISSVGNNPATEVTMAIMNQDILAISDVLKETYLRTNDPPIIFRPSISNMVNLDETKPYQLICQYQDIFSDYPNISFHQTSLPFKITKSNGTQKLVVTVGKMELLVISKIKLNEFYYSKVKFND